jgi:polar amino acid transport system substrate-binding protein
MKKHAKILALVLSGLTALAVLAGCGASHKDWEEIGPKGEMIIGVTPNAPMNYQDENGDYTLGFDTEFAEAVCEILEVKAKFLEIDWNSKEAELKSKNIDAVWNGMTITEQRAKEMDISTPYMNNRPVIVVRAADLDKYQSADDLTGVALVAESGSTLEECVNAQTIFAKADYTPVDKQLTGLMEVLAGTADMTVVDGTLAAEEIKAGSDFAALAIIDKNFPSEEYGIAFRKNSPETLKKVNDAIKQLKDDGTLQAIADKYGLGLLLIK